MEFWIILYGASVFFSAFLVAFDALTNRAARGDVSDLKPVVVGCLVPAINLIIAGVALAAIVNSAKGGK
jgi:hypothetical protein